MEEFAKYLAVAIVGVLGGTGVVLVILFLSPHVIEKWASLFYRILYRVFGIAHKRYVQYDLQARINEFTADLAKEAPFVAETRVGVEWADAGLTRDAFLKDGKVIVRLRREDRRDENFIHGAFMFVSTGLLHGVKRYLSPTQRESVDLFVTTKLLEREKAHLLGIFLDEYLHPRAAKSDKVARNLDAFEKIQRAGLFFPVLLQELHFLGGKIFGKRQDDRIIAEVGALSDFLEAFAGRHVGEELDLKFERDYCRVAIVIVGKSYKLTETGEVWVSFIRQHLIPKRIETIYLLGPWLNRGVMDRVAGAFTTTYEVHRSSRYKARILDRKGNAIEVDDYVVVLRLFGVSTIQTSS